MPTHDHLLVLVVCACGQSPFRRAVDRRHTRGESRSKGHGLETPTKLSGLLCSARPCGVGACSWSACTCVPFCALRELSITVDHDLGRILSYKCSPYCCRCLRGAHSRLISLAWRASSLRDTQHGRRVRPRAAATPRVTPVSINQALTESFPLV